MHRTFFLRATHCGGDIGSPYVCGSYKVIILWARLKEKIDTFTNSNA